MSVFTSSLGATASVNASPLNDAFLSDSGVAPAKADAAPIPFAGVLLSMVQQTSQLDQKASEAVTGLLNGSGVEVHDAMIATQKATMAFELALQVRNKAVGAYQQMIGMQF
jgi:flagellar hook-basal body complex protein FliE